MLHLSHNNLQKKDGERGPAHAQRWGAQAAAGASRVAADEAAGHPHCSGPGRQQRWQQQQQGAGPDQEEAASRRSPGPNTRGDPIRFELPGKAPQVKTLVIFVDFILFVATFTTFFLNYLYLFLILFSI